MSHFRRFILFVTLTLLGAAPVAAQFDTEVLERIERDMAEIRGLELLEPISVSAIPTDEYMAETVAELDSDYPPAEREVDARVLRAFGLLAADEDLGEAYAELLGGGVAGYYDPATGEMVIVTVGDGEELSAFDQVTYAHETVHALQDQHFDLGALLESEAEMTTDQSLAMRSLVEGDATLAELDFVLSDPELAQAYLSDVEAMGIDEDIYSDLPTFLTGTLTFPYSQGFEFAQYLHDEGGWELINEAYGDLPASSEQILHPEKYLSGEMPIEVQVMDSSANLGPDWQEVDRDTMGEFVISIILGESELSDDQVELASAGWGGDAYSVIATDDELAIVWETAWDSEQDATEFARALAIREGERLSAEVSSDGAETSIMADGASVRIVQDGTTVSYLQASSEPRLDRLEVAADAPEATPTVNQVVGPLAGTNRRGEDAA